MANEGISAVRTTDEAHRPSNGRGNGYGGFLAPFIYPVLTFFKKSVKTGLSAIVFYVIMKMS